MDPHEDVLGAFNVAHHKREVRLAGELLAERDPVELAVLGGQANGCAALDELLVAAAVLDEIGDGDHLQAVLLAVGDEVGDARHRAVVLHHLANHAGRDEPSEPGEVDGGFGLADALQHTAGLSAQREDMARLDDVARAARRVDRNLDRAGAVAGGDPGGDAVARLDRDRERRAERRLVLLGHLPQPQLVAALWREAEADQAATVGRHEVHRGGCCKLGCDRQIAFVLAVSVVTHDHEAAGADLLDRLLDRRERRCLGLFQLDGHLVMVAAPSEATRGVRRTWRGRRPRDSRCDQPRVSRTWSLQACAGSARARTCRSRP